MITIGILVAFLSDTAFSYSGNWRWMLGIIAIPGALFLFGVLLLPDSPRWLMMRNRKDEAISVLQRLRGDAQIVAREAADIEEQLRTPQRGWHLFLENSNFRRSVAFGVMLQLVQQFTGMNVVMYYAPRIFQDMGYDIASQMWFTAAVGLTNVLATFIAIGLVDRWGRKPILYTGFSVMAVGLGIVGTMMHLGITSHGEQTFTVAMLLLFIVGFAMSAGPRRESGGGSWYGVLVGRPPVGEVVSGLPGVPGARGAGRVAERGQRGRREPADDPGVPVRVPRIAPGQPWAAPPPPGPVAETPTHGAGPASNAAATIDAPVRGLVTSTRRGRWANHSNWAWSIPVLVPSQFHAAYCQRIVM